MSSDFDKGSLEKMNLPFKMAFVYIPGKIILLFSNVTF